MGNSVLDRLARHAPVMKTVSLPRARHRLHAMPTSTGYEIRTDSSYAWDGRARGQTPFTVLQYTVAGAGNLLYERRRYRLQPGDTMLCVVPHNHRYWVEDGGRWEFFWLSITGQEAVRMHRLILAATGPVFRLKPRDHRASGGAEPAPHRRRRRSTRCRLGDRLRGRDDALRRGVSLAMAAAGPRTVKARCAPCSTMSGPISKSRLPSSTLPR